MLEDNIGIQNALESTQKGKYLTFSLDEEFYGIDIINVTEIVGIQPIVVMPELPSFLKGVINLRGEIIPVMDARNRFDKDEVEYNDRTCIIVVDVKQASIGIIVDAVSEVLSMEDKNIVPPPLLVSGAQSYVKAIGKDEDQVILILDCEKIIDDDELGEIKAINE